MRREPPCAEQLPSDWRGRAHSQHQRPEQSQGAGCAHGFCSTVSSGRHMLSSITRRESNSSASSPEIVGFGFQERTFAVSSSKARPGPELSV